MDYLLLHPDRRHVELNRLIDDRLDEFGAPENVNDVDLLRHLKQRPIGLLSQAFLNPGIHRNDAVAVALHVGRNPMTGTQGVVGESDHRNGFGLLQQFSDGIGLR
jgi:hypothetical protein